MNQFDIDKAYVSPYDKFLSEFDQTHILSPSQLKEMATYRRIFALRDGNGNNNEPSILWEEF